MAEVLLTLKLRNAAEVQQAVDGVNDALRDQTEAVNRLAAQQQQLQSSMTAFQATAGFFLRSVLGPALALLGAGRIVGVADDFRLYRQRLALVTDSVKDAVATERALFELSQETGTQFKANLGIFTRFARNAETIGLSGQAILQVTGNINRLIVVSGAAAEESTAALIQLSQGFASGQLRGEELRSVMEQLPAVIQTVSGQLGLTIGQFRTLSFAGEISARDVADALIAATSEIEAESSAMGDTGSRAFTRITNALFVLNGRVFEVTGAMDFITDTLNKTAALVGSLDRVVEGFRAAERINISSALPLLLKQALSLVTGGILDFLADRVEQLGDTFRFFQLEIFQSRLDRFAESIRDFKGRLVADVSAQSIVDALFSEGAAAAAAHRAAREAERAEERAQAEAEAEERLAARKQELQDLLAAKETERHAKATEAARKAKAEREKLEANRLRFLADSNSAALERLRELWRQRLQASEDKTRERLEALEALSDINQEIAEREIGLLEDLTLERQRERLLRLGREFTDQSAQGESGALAFAAAIDKITEALRLVEIELQSRKTGAQDLAERFRQSFVTAPDAVFSALTGARQAFRGFFVDVFTRAKDLGEAFKDLLTGFGRSILRNFAQLIADRAFQSLLGLAGRAAASLGGEGVARFIGGVSRFLTGGAQAVRGAGATFAAAAEGQIGLPQPGFFGRIFGGGGRISRLFRPSTAGLGNIAAGAIFGILLGADPMESIASGIGSAIGSALAGPIGGLIGGFLGGRLLGPILGKVFGGGPKLDEVEEGKVRAIVSWDGRIGATSIEPGVRAGTALIRSGIIDRFRDQGVDLADIPSFSVGLAPAVPIFRKDMFRTTATGERKGVLAPGSPVDHFVFRIGTTAGDFIIPTIDTMQVLNAGGESNTFVGIRNLGSPTRGVMAGIEFAMQLLSRMIPTQGVGALGTRTLAFGPKAGEEIFVSEDQGVDSVTGWLAGQFLRVGELTNEHTQTMRVVSNILKSLRNAGVDLGRVPAFTVAWFRQAEEQFAIRLGQILFRPGVVGDFKPFRTVREATTFGTSTLLPMVSAQTGASRVVTRPTMFLAGERGAERASLRPLNGRRQPAVRLNINAPAFFGGTLTRAEVERRLARAAQRAA